MSDIVTKLRNLADGDPHEDEMAPAELRALADLVEAARKFHAACTTGSPLTWARRVAEAHQDNAAALARLDGEGA